MNSSRDCSQRSEHVRIDSIVTSAVHNNPQRPGLFCQRANPTWWGQRSHLAPMWMTERTKTRFRP